MEWTTWNIIGALVVVLVVYCWRKWSYWSSCGVTHVPASKAIYNQILAFIRKDKSVWKFMDEYYHEYKDQDFVGTYFLLVPTIMALSPDLTKTIMIKDFDHFTDRRTIDFSGEDEYMKEMLTATKGNHWKSLRAIVSPTFTSGKMRRLFPLVDAKARILVKHFARLQHTAPHIGMKKSFSHYIMDVIASCAFGIEVNTLENENEFSYYVSKLSEVSGRRIAKFFALMVLPKFVTSALGIRFTGPAMAFFHDVVVEAIKQRGGPSKRGDFLDLMLEQRANQSNDQGGNSPKYPLEDVTIIAQSVLFLLVGHDTTANMLAFTSFYLAKYPHLQQRLRQEIRSILQEDGSLPYQALMEAPFLDACISESLRLHPPAVAVERMCTKDYTLPGYDVVVKKGQVVSFPVWSLQNDPRYWSNPEEYCPDRFMPENKASIVNGTYLPFGLGPRNCIGMRFAQMESKLVLARIVLEFEMTPAPGHEDLKLSLMAMRPTDDIYLNLKTISEDQKGNLGSEHFDSKDSLQCTNDSDPEKANSEIIIPTN